MHPHLAALLAAIESGRIRKAEQRCNIRREEIGEKKRRKKEEEEMVDVLKKERTRRKHTCMRTDGKAPRRTCPRWDRKGWRVLVV